MNRRELFGTAAAIVMAPTAIAMEKPEEPAEIVFHYSRAGELLVTVGDTLANRKQTAAILGALDTPEIKKLLTKLGLKEK